MYTNMQQFNKTHAHVTMFVSVCTIITRQNMDYAITMMYRFVCATMQACAQV